MSALVMASYVVFSDSSPYCTLCWAGIIGYGLYYMALDLEAGLIAAPFLLAVGYLTNYLHADYPDQAALVLKAALAQHILSWACQFYGHFHYEGNAPAVFDNLVQPLVLAPYFVIFEIMFIFGHRKPLEKKILRQAKIVLDEHNKEKRVKKNM
ncbi:DEKNAAC100137 [Brettanomyces naardenensis]|uniref:DEKNAAC100137 n=1 Tax=Brettanomyces naardenensis TaxID=13370 RepID=A0A448YFQ8_BRENA|nr:DEKNAAC100137 [Brettanomyces naardenensis]